MRKLGSLLLVGFVFLLMQPAAQADTTAIALTSYTNYTNGQWTLGFTFSPVANIDVTSLGSYFPGGATDVHGVTLWDTLGNVLATTTVTGTGVEGFDFTAISPLVLLGGVTYVVGANTLNDNYADGNAAWTVDAGINYITHVETTCAGVTPCFPGAAGTNTFGDFGANFQFTQAQVPEPASIMLLGTGLLALGGRFRRKKT
jgi:hypothetical protein